MNTGKTHDATVVERVREMLVKGDGDSVISDVVDIPRSTVQSMRRRWKAGKLKADSQPEQGFTDEVAAGERRICSVSSHIRTEAEAVAYGEINLEVWQRKRCKINHWEVPTKHPQSGEVTISDLWQVSVWFEAVEQDELQLERIARKTIVQMEAHSPLAYKALRQKPLVVDASGKMLELDLFDVHLGSLSWPTETGVAYDTEIAATRYMHTLDRLVSLAADERIEQVLLPTGNDFLHSDTDRGTTTGDTSLDMDTRATRAFERGKLLLVAAIDRLLHVAPVVRVPIIPGNHDRLSMLHLGSVLAAWYRHAGDRVVIDASPRLRKYVEWHGALIGLTHGSEEKRERLPMIMAHEQAAAWARTRHREWRIGHLHHKRRLLVPLGDTQDGVWIRQSAALASRDAYHVRKGFVTAAPAASATLWDKVEGPVVEYNLKVETL